MRLKKKGALHSGKVKDVDVAQFHLMSVDDSVNGSQKYEEKINEIEVHGFEGGSVKDVQNDIERNRELYKKEIQEEMEE